MTLQKRRRIESKTDYKARLALIKSGIPRLAIRKTNKYIIVQFIISDSAQDKIIASSLSKDLISKGWPSEQAGSLKSLSAAYLTGYMLAKKVLGKYKEAILDIGLHRSIPKSRIYSALKGAIDAGLKIAHNPKVLPSEEELSNIKSWKLAEKVKEKL